MTAANPPAGRQGIPAAGRGSAPPSPVAVREARQRLVTFLRSTDQDAAAWVEQVSASRPETPTVVVVGETKRGKSSLVNALLATPGLSHVAADVATARYLVLRHGPDWSARACYPGLRDPVPIPMPELASWISAGHELPGDALPPRYVEVHGPVPLLERLTLVDTPGVGGLSAAHGELAAEAAAGATALLYVADAAAPLTGGELTFLRRLSDHVETVVFALTKVDAHRGWRHVLAADRALLAEHAPRFADAEFLPVSARLFESAAAAPTPEVAAVLRNQSGIAELQVTLQRQVAGRAGVLAEANALRALSTALAGVVTRLTAEQRALADAERGEAATEHLRRRRRELTAQRRATGRSWQLRLRAEVQRARLESLRDVAGQVSAAQAWFRRAIDEADRAALAQLPYQLDVTLQLMSARVTAGLADRLSRVTEAALAELFTPAELNAVLAELARRSSGHPSIVLGPPDRRPMGVEDKLLVAMGISGGIGAGRLATLPLAGLPLAGLPVAGLGAAAAIAVLPASIVLGLGAGWWLARARRQAADKVHLKQWLADVLIEARAALDQVVAEQMIDAEQQLSLMLDEAIGQRVAVIDDELSRIDRSLRLDAADRRRELTAVGQALAEAIAGRERAEQLLARLAELRDRRYPRTGSMEPWPLTVSRSSQTERR